MVIAKPEKAPILSALNTESESTMACNSLQFKVDFPCRPEDTPGRQQMKSMIQNSLLFHYTYRQSPPRYRPIGDSSSFYNMNESFFQLPASLLSKPAGDGAVMADGDGSLLAGLGETQPALLYVPETQYTPDFDERDKGPMTVNVAMGQSMLLPSVGSVLGASARSVRKQHAGGGREHASVTNSPPFLQHHQRFVDKLDLPSQKPNSPLLLGNRAAGSRGIDLTEDSSLLLALESSLILDNEGTEKENDFNCGIGTHHPHRSSSLLHPKFSLDFLNTPPAAASILREESATQMLIQNCSEAPPPQNLSYQLEFGELGFTSADAPDEGHHDAILFPASFDECNNPFSYNYVQEQHRGAKEAPPATRSPDPAVFEGETTVLESQTTPKQVEANPPLTDQFGILSNSRIRLSARKAMPTKSTPLVIKRLGISQSSSNESIMPASPTVSIPASLKKSLGTRLRRNFQAAPSTSTAAAEQRLFNQVLPTKGKKISVIQAQPRKTPICGISAKATQPRDCSQPDAPNRAGASVLERQLNPTAGVYCEDQLVFFREGSQSNPMAFPVAQIVNRPSKTRDIWRLKHPSSGQVFTMASQDICPVACLRDNDKVYLCARREERYELSGPFTFSRFSPQNPLTAELQRKSPTQLYDCLKITKIAVDRGTFGTLRERFERGCLEDVQANDQITASFMQSPRERENKRKQQSVSPSEATPSHTPIPTRILEELYSSSPHSSTSTSPPKRARQST